MKKESRKAVVTSSSNTSLFALCVFRGNFLEKIMFAKSKEELLNLFNNSSLKGEVKAFVNDGEEVEICNMIVDKIGRKLNKLQNK
jgi:hypothetical protein